MPKSSVYPLIKSARDAQRCVGFLAYPQEGSRGWGPFAAHARFGTSLRDYSSVVGPRLTCCVLIETAEAIADIDTILDTPGIDVVGIITQFDLSSSLGVKGQFDSPVLAEAVTTVERAARGRLPLGGGRPSLASRAPPSQAGDTGCC